MGFHPDGGETKKEGRIVGTPDYMPPEMLEGRGLDRPTIDYWALGVILFELLIGIPPFNADTIDKVFSNIKNYKIPWEDIVDEEGEEIISADAKNLVLSLLNPDPNKRLGAVSVQDIKSHPFFQGKCK